MHDVIVKDDVVIKNLIYEVRGKQANSEDPSGVIRNWMSNKNTFEYYSL